MQFGAMRGITTFWWFLGYWEIEIKPKTVGKSENIKSKIFKIKVKFLKIKIFKIFLWGRGSAP